MTRSVFFSLALSALLIYAVIRMVDLFERATPMPLTRVDVYADHIDYRTSRYPTPSRFAIGLKAVREPPAVLGLHDCASMDRFEAVLQILREEGYSSFAIELPEDC